MIKKEINIIGGGCAALSLARLIRNLPNYKLNLFIGNKNKTNKDHFWGFWKVKINYEAYNKANHVWSKWSINTNDSKHILTSVKHPYCVIKRKKWLDICKKQLPSQKFRIFKNDVHEKDGQLFNKNKKIKGDYVFDSRPNKSPFSMKQIFKGIFVEFHEPLENFKAHLMDFSDKDQFHFFYSLPLGKTKYLFESTYYTSLNMVKELMANEVHDYIKERFGGGYSVVREEYGEIPLTTDIKLNENKSNYIKIGIPAGSTRASTGYTFLNIQKQADEYIRMLNGKKFIEYPKTFKNKILRKMDNLLLMIIRDHPSESKKILFEMFNRNKAKRIIRFLSDTPTAVDIVSIIWNMPKVIFIKYAIKSFTASKI